MPDWALTNSNEISPEKNRTINQNILLKVSKWGEGNEVLELFKSINNKPDDEVIYEINIDNNEKNNNNES